MEEDETGGGGVEGKKERMTVTQTYQPQLHKSRRMNGMRERGRVR